MDFNAAQTSGGKVRIVPVESPQRRFPGSNSGKKPIVRPLFQVAPTAISMRKEFYEQIAHTRPKHATRFYNRLVQKYFRLIIPEDAKVLEVGCGVGDLLASLNPSRGVGVDFSPTIVNLASMRHSDLEFIEANAENFQIDEKFDYIVLSDLVNDLEDVQQVFDCLRQMAHSKTRIVINFFNDFWRPILAVAAKQGWKSPTPKHQNWLTLPDVENMLALAGWQKVKSDNKILIPINLGFISGFVNRWIAPLPLVRSLALSKFIVARPAHVASSRTSDMVRDYSCTVVIPSRNEAGNIEHAVRRTPDMGLGTEIIFIEGGSSDFKRPSPTEISR